MEGAVDLERGKVIGKLELMGCIGAVEDDVEGKVPWFRPFLFVGANELLCSELQSVILLIRRVR